MRRKDVVAYTRAVQDVEDEGTEDRAVAQYERVHRPKRKKRKYLPKGTTEREDNDE
jgi:hypothetical protein